MADVNFEELENNEFVFDLPVPFDTNAFAKRKTEEIKKTKEQLERIEKIKETNYPEKEEEIRRSLIKSLEETMGKHEIEIYPVQMKDYYLFRYYIISLLLEKNNPKLYKDVGEYAKIVSMSYIDYLAYRTNDGSGVDWFLFVCALFQMVFHITISKYSYYEENGHYTLVLNDEIFISKDDFDTLRKVIVRQNLDVEINDFKNDAQLEAEEVSRIKSRGLKEPTFEERITAYCALKHCTKAEALNATVRTFNLELGMLMDIEEYEISKIGIMSGNIMLPKGNSIEHYLYKKENANTFEGGGFVPLEEMKNKINS
jgi:hypothetical protein